MENYPSYLRIPTWKMWGAFLAATIGCFAFMDPIYERLGYQADYPGIRTYLSPPYQVFWLFSFAYLVGLFINLKILLRKIIYYFRRSFRDLSIQEKYARFEDIESVKVGLLKFKPTLVLKDGHYIGPGKEIVEAILGEKLQWETGLTLTWKNMLEQLDSKRYDLLATPVYDTPDRRILGEFSTPLYYANMGIYVRSGGDIRRALPDSKEYGFLDLIDILSSKSLGIKTLVNKGELNQLVIEKHFSEIELEYVDAEFDIELALEEVSSVNSGRELLVCEKWIAESNRWVIEKQVVNILADKQLLYPVVFMMRRGEETLRKFINLRLMAMYDSGEFEKLLSTSLYEVYGDAQYMTHLFEHGIGHYFYRGKSSFELLDFGKSNYQSNVRPLRKE